MERYQDYVIKDGKLVGKFEEMYKRFADPWEQAALGYNINSYSKYVAIQNIRRLDIKSVVEFGCGLGYYTSLLRQDTGAAVKGVDISKTAVEKARELWKDLDFSVDNVRNIRNYSDYDAILFAEITWYILDELPDVFDDMLKYFHGKYFLNNLVFYKTKQQYGVNLFRNLKEFIEYVPFELVGWSEATLVEDECVETSTIFRIKQKKPA